MLKFYYNAAPNPMKIALLLEELELPYEPIPVDTRKGEQFALSFLAVNPNAKLPAIVDGDVTSSTATQFCCTSPIAHRSWCPDRLMQSSVARCCRG